MPTRAMIIVAGGSSTRFGRDKLTAEVSGRPLISHTIEAVAAAVDRCVVSCHPDILDRVACSHPAAVVTAGGPTRTASEIAGLEALGEIPDLIGVHDAARPIISPALIERLFETAAHHGGAVPILDPGGPILERSGLTVIEGVGLAQTPQVFRGPEMRAAYAQAAASGFDGHDTVDVMHRFSDVVIAAVPGDPRNVKVTYPADLKRVAAHLTDPSRT